MTNNHEATTTIPYKEYLALIAERDRLLRLVAYLAGENTDDVQVYLGGNPIVCDAVIAEARAALKGGEDE